MCGSADVRGGASAGVRACIELFPATARPRQSVQIGLSLQAIDDITGFLSSVAVRHSIHYLWRPVLPDPKDDMVLEVAVAGQCAFIVTYNVKHFRGAEQFGIEVITPQELLKKIGALP